MRRLGIADMPDCELHFRVEPDLKIPITEYATWESRGECAVEMLVDLVENWPELFVGRSGAICYRDRPPGPEWASGCDLAFCTTKRLGEPSPFLPFPCPNAVRWPQVGIPDAVELMEKLLADDAPCDDERIFWIGAETHPSRRALSQLARREPGRFDVEVMRWVKDADGRQRSATRQVSLPEHRRYKYLVDCPGNGYSGRVKWLLATGRPVFIVDREIVEPWHEELEPWVHFVPVAADFSDFLDHHARVEADPSLYEAIGGNARRFAAEHLRVEAQLTRTAEAVAKTLGLPFHADLDGG